jgi:PPM family protein phosphatase
MTDIYLRVVGTTDIGNVRSNNEDSFVVADLSGNGLELSPNSVGRFNVGDRGVLMAVSDGMGGLMAGEVASALVVEGLPPAIREERPSAPGEQLLDASVQKVNTKVWKEAQLKGIRMGATLTAVYVDGPVAWIAEVGDSRAYLVRAGNIVQLTKDQSLVQSLLDAGAISPEEAAHSPHRGVILQAMGHDPEVSAALGRLELRALDCLVLCSDGLTAHVSDEDIRSIVLTSVDLTVACHRLVALAKERGGLDNITVVIGGVDGPLPMPRVSKTDIGETFEVVRQFS